MKTWGKKPGKKTWDGPDRSQISIGQKTGEPTDDAKKLAHPPSKRARIARIRDPFYRRLASSNTTFVKCAVISSNSAFKSLSFPAKRSRNGLKSTALLTSSSV